PDVGKGAVEHVVEGQGGDGFGCVTGEHTARRRHIEADAAPAAHASLRIVGIVIGRHIVDHEFTLQALPCLPDGLICLDDLLAGRHQRSTVPLGPAVELHRRDLDTPRAELNGEIEHFLDLVHVLLVADGIDGQRYRGVANPARHGDLAIITAGIAADPVGQIGRAPLDGKLHVVEPGIGQFLDPFFGEANPGRDQVGIEPKGACGAGQFDKVAPGSRFAARKVQVEHAEIGGLPEDADPILRTQLFPDPGQLQRIGAIGAGEGAAMCQLRQQRHRRRDMLPLRPLLGLYFRCDGHATISSIRRSDSSCTNAVTSAAICSFGTWNAAAKSSAMRSMDRSPSNASTILWAMSSRARARSGASSTICPRTSSLRSLTPRASLATVAPSITVFEGASLIRSLPWFAMRRAQSNSNHDLHTVPPDFEAGALYLVPLGTGTPDRIGVVYMNIELTADIQIGKSLKTAIRPVDRHMSHAAACF